MKATGIVRRIDDLGRVVIPREIRRNLGIHENDLLEIFINEDGGVVFRPCSMMEGTPARLLYRAMKKFGIAGFVVDTRNNVLAGSPTIKIPFDFDAEDLVSGTKPIVDGWSATPIWAEEDIVGAVIFCSRRSEVRSIVENIATTISVMLDM